MILAFKIAIILVAFTVPGFLGEEKP